MQIHELTKRRKKRADEGLLSGLKDAYTAAKTGFGAGRASDARNSNVAGATGALGALTSPSAYAAASAKNAETSAMAKYNKVMGIDPNAPAQPAAPAATGQSDIAAVTKQITSTPEFADLSQVLPDPGQLLMVTMKNGGKYYKDENGVWKNESGEAIKGSPGEDGYGKAFDKVLDADQYTQEPVTSVSWGANAGTAAASTKTNTARTAPVKEARNPMATRSAASVVKGIIAKNQTLAKKLSDPTVQQAVQAASAKLDTVAQTRGMAAKSKKKKMVSAAQAMAKAVVGTGQAAAPGAQAGQDQQAQAQPGVAAQGGQASLVQKNIAAQTITSKAKVDGAQLAKAVAADPQVKQAVATIAKESKRIKIREASADSAEMVPWTDTNKPFRIKYNGKEYTYRNTPSASLTNLASSKLIQPQWYEYKSGWWSDKLNPVDSKLSNTLTQLVNTDPKLSPAKNAMASADRAYNKQEQDKANAPNVAQQKTQQKQQEKEKLEKDTADSIAKHNAGYAARMKADPAGMLRQQKIDHHNAQVKDVTDQLRNAEIFNTGQAPYLKQQLASLMAMKFEAEIKSLDNKLMEAIQMLKEEQVYITKDIRIRTAKGDYVKRVSDQQWYDPNGVMIDPDKYADYIKKLDATPMAQTQYQADAQKAAKGRGPGGTDTGAQQSAAAAAAAPPPPPPPQAPAATAPAPQEDPMDQALKQQKMAQWLRGQNVDSLNAQIKDTTNQLRNAQIFGTGQADYLQQQLAQLIAMKV
jgi:hypothetical protein